MVFSASNRSSSRVYHFLSWVDFLSFQVATQISRVFFDDHLGGETSNIFYVHPETWGRGTHFDSYFSNGLVQPPTSHRNEV